MKKLLWMTAFCLAALVGRAQEGAKNFIDQNYIEINGNDKTEVTPDQIFIGFTISEADTKGKTSVSDMEKRMMDALGKLGLDLNNKLKVSDLASNFKKYVLGGRDVQVGKSYRLEAGDAKMAARVFYALEGIGVSNASIDRVDHSQMEKLRAESKVRAVQDARARATMLAEALGQSIRQAMYIQDVERYYQPVTYAANAKIMMRGAGNDAAGDIPDIDFEKIRIESNVLVRFRLWYK
ncbi:MAG: SIMPL domain-containing protein [Rikenellaceae bacterium]|jgi:uncharacterized protein YggE|nr:SIMPL domain-containing protein [Rikenellaceae bacterium]